MGDSLYLPPVKKVEGELTLPGSKSLSNRALLLAAVAKGTTLLENILLSDDTRYMLNALVKLGVDCKLDESKRHCLVQGRGGPFDVSEKPELYLGNAGTAMRPLSAMLSASKGEYRLTGDPRMKERPIAHLVDALRRVGATIKYLENEGYPPLEISADGLAGGKTQIDGSLSSQFLTALLMAAPLAQSDVQITVINDLVSKPYIDITLDLMQRFGVKVGHEDYTRFHIPARQSYIAPATYMVEGDASSASYFLAAAAIKGGCVRVYGVGASSIQGDKAFADVLEEMGAKVAWEENAITVCRGERLRGIDKDCNHIPDAAMTLATAALFAEGPTTLRNIYNWRLKETDRLSAMATELRKTGAEVEEGSDYLRIVPPPAIKHAKIDTYDDHRMAMAFSLLALAPATVTINDPECTAKTFPEYFEFFKKITHV